MEKKEDLGSIGIAFGQGEEVKVVVSYVEVLPTYQYPNDWTSTEASVSRFETNRWCIH